MSLQVLFPDNLNIMTHRRDPAVLSVRDAEAPSPQNARRLARELAAHRIPGIDDIDIVSDCVVISFDPGTLTRGHLELLIHTAVRDALLLPSRS